MTLTGACAEVSVPGDDNRGWNTALSCETVQR
jgi:hypothetical protein